MPGAYISLSSEVLPANQGVRAIRHHRRQRLRRPDAGALPRAARRAPGRGGLRRRRARSCSRTAGWRTIAESVRLAAGAVLSGPAGGIAGGRHAARVSGEGNLITFDMGGTSTDIALLEGGEPHLTGDRSVAGSKVALPSIDIHTLGAGGGSIARVDAGGILHVGPESAGADPGPACYGRGGTLATVTDANAALGPPRSRATSSAGACASTWRPPRSRWRPWPRRSASRRSVRRRESGASSTPTWPRASASCRCAAAPTRGASRSCPSGARPGFTSPTWRGCWRSAACSCPRVASVLSAWGMLATDLRHEFVRTHVGEARQVGAARLRRLFGEMEVDGRRATRQGLRRGRRGEAIGGHALRRADLRDPGTARRRRRGRRRRDGPGRRALPPAPRGALHLQHGGTGRRAGERAPRGDRPPARPARRGGGADAGSRPPPPGAAASTSTAGRRRPSTTSPRSPPTRRSRAPRSSSPPRPPSS